ncbi:ABC transporter permease [Nocardioides sp. SYSU D00038]|uniref:ABC transporter permease n=1 Tax=Nocardioides sp. SYSU D00038 TaxID=2812554 RepID=UPI0019681083|nr:ABC transporter permease [Nocardioides sp. SYSU D00038]
MTEAQPVRVVDAPLLPASHDQGLVEVFRRRYLLKLLVRREITARYSGSFLGMLWSYINPLSQFAVYYFVMGVLFNLHEDIPNFPLHMFSAIIVVHFFTETFAAGTRSIMRNKALVRKMAMPREMFPVASMLVSLFHVLPQVVILVIAAVVSGWTPDAVGMMYALLAIAVIMLLGTALALMFSVANVFFRDFGSFVGILTMYVRFGVPMIYPFTMVEERFGRFADYYLLNPIADAVLLFQRAFWVGTSRDVSREEMIVDHMPDGLLMHGMVALGVSAALLVVAQLVFTRLENKIPERLT